MSSENTALMIIKLIESEGYKMVDVKRLDVLEKVVAAAQRWRAGMIDKIGYTNEPAERERRMHENRVSTLNLRNAVDEWEGLNNAGSAE